MQKSSDQVQSAIIRYSPYLQEIRKRLLMVVVVFFLGSIGGFVYFEKIIAVILAFYKLEGLNIVFTSPFQFMNLAINSGIIVGLITVFPFFLYQLLSFLKPALKETEYQMIIGAIPFSIMLFVFGFGFGTWIMRLVVVMFSHQSTQLQIQNVWDIEHFLSNIFLTSLCLGVFFQFPIVITILIRLKVMTRMKIIGLRLPIYVALLVFTMMLPPTDILSNVLIFLPLALLFELTLILNRSYKLDQEVNLYVK